jgi:hypothetical protein
MSVKKTTERSTASEGQRRKGTNDNEKAMKAEEKEEWLGRVTSFFFLFKKSFTKRFNFTKKGY